MNVVSFTCETVAMKKITILLLGCFSLLFASGQTGRISLDSSVQRLHRAMLVGDGQQLDQLTSDSLTYGHSGGKIEDKQSFIQHLVSGESDFLQLDVSDQQSTIVKNVAWVRLNMAAEIIDNGNRMNVKLKILYVWLLQKGQWKLLARQAVKMVP